MKMLGTIFKSGNSYAVRLPKEYVVRHKLKLRQGMVLPDEPAIKRNTYSGEQFWSIVASLQKTKA